MAGLNHSRILLAMIFACLVAPFSIPGQNSFSEEVSTANSSGSLRATARITNSPAPSKQSASTNAPADSRFAQAATMETKDFNVASPKGLHDEPMHAPTPTRIEGGQVISTEALHTMYEKKESFVVFDVLGGQQILPNAQNAIAASRGGSFNDATQREFGNYLQQMTRGNKDLPLVFYCQSIECWMSYNAALRAIKLGYTKVYWYRGGIEAWQSAGLPTPYRQ